MGLNGRDTSEGEVKMPLMFSLIRPGRNVFIPAAPVSQQLCQLRRVLLKVTLYTVPPASSVM
jgi:hypothetical protein